MKNYIVLLLLFFSVSANAQFAQLSEASEISIITIGPGAELYDKFGHSAFRIQDSINGMDVVFNYGEYDFNTPNFYLKFAQGKLLYQLGVDYYKNFYPRYVAQNRWMKEQVLNLTHSEKQELSDFLWNNARPENKKYKYDFFYDNCATKMRDVVWTVLGKQLEFNDDHITEKLTFRQLIQLNLEANSWGSLGIDTALGAIIDTKAKPIEYQFLPEYVFQGAANAFINRNGEKVSLVKETNTLYQNTPTPSQTNFFLSPLFIFGLIGALIVFITYRDFKNNKRSRFLDLFIFLSTGVIGIFLSLLWFATDHSATANNYNLLWAFPISIFVIIAVVKKDISSNMKRYFILLLVLLSLLTLHWITGVQVFAIGLLPLLIALAIRYIFLVYYVGKK
ncbi:DUF4105 domain-containing protein [Aequorivita sediminis]|uniref:lipoprotein N-acyltransferase Lnb domain-containing protein n=1 Tax=Aequorivita sediminis TaxID=3073653 RepID=UPI0028B0A23D|nr:DUF4105 domain-containing protein [Aequorivita sp. F6058]